MARAKKLSGVGALEQAGLLNKEQLLTHNEPPGMFDSPYDLKAGSDPRYLGAAPDRTEVGLFRYKPKKGTTSRAKNAIEGLKENRGGSYDALMADIDAGLSVDADSWYNTEELRDWFINELGEEQGNAEWADFMNLMGATSPGNKVPSNIRVASYYRNKGPEWIEKNIKKLKEGKLVPPEGSGYGHKMQRLHAQNVGKLYSGDWDSSPEPGVTVAKSKGYQNPKARGFAGSLMGGTKNIAADLHFTRLMGMASGDPDWLDTGPTISDSLANKLKETHGRKINKYLQVNKNGDTVFKAKNAVKDGLVSLDEIADEPSVWTSAPNDTEYAAFEDFIYEVAQERGLTGPQAQAALWMGAAKRTGVADESQGTFMQLFRNRADKRAEETGQTREQVISDFIKNRGLLNVPVVAGGGALLGSLYSPEAPAMPVDDSIPDWREVYGSEVNTEMPPSAFDNKLEAARALGAGFTGGILGDLSRIGGYINPFSDVESVDADAVALQNQVVRALSGGDVSPGAQKYLEPIQQVDEAQVGTLSAIDRAMRVGGEEEADQYLKRQFPRGYGIADVLNQYLNPLSY